MTAAQMVWIDGIPYKPALSEAMIEVLALIRAEPGIHMAEISRRRDEMHALLARRAYRPYSLSTITSALSLLWRLGLAQRTPAHGYFLTPLGEATQDALWYIEEAA